MKADDCSTGTMIMRASRRVVVTLALLPSAVSVAVAQSSATAGASEPLRLLGLSVAASGGPRDTLGLLVATVVRDGPADQAGITTGSRVLAVNGLAVRLSPNDIGRPRAADSVLQRFDEVIRSTSSSADVTLRIVGGGRTRNVSLATADRRSAKREASAEPGSGAPTSAAPTSGAPTISASPTAATVMSAPAAAPAPDSLRRTDSAPSATLATAAVQAATAVPTALPTEATPPAPATLSVLIDALLSVQLDLRRLARDAQPRALSDSLTDLEHDVALLRARLRRVQGAPTAAGITGGSASIAAVTPPTAPATPTAANVAPSVAPTAPAVPVSVASAPNVSLAGLELARVTGDLAVFLGPQADAALLVQSASDVWEPLRAGDVVLKVDGGTPDLMRLRDALSAQQPVTLVVLRRGRTFTVAFGGARQP